MIDPELELAIAWQRDHPTPPLRALPLETARANYDEAAALLDPQPPDDVSCDEMVLMGPAGEIPARLYVPAGGDRAGIVVWGHGGGWVIGSLVSHDQACRRLAAASGQRILAVAYRLAPEHPFPAGQDDLTAATRWVLEHARALSAPSVGVGGDSAGAMLALVAALEVADGLSCLALCYPPLGPRIRSASRRALDRDWGLTDEDMTFFYDMLVPEDQDRSDPRLSPLLSEDVSVAPPTVLAIAGYDPLHDEGFALGALLEGAGVEVHLLEERALTHGYLRLGGLSAEVRAAVDRLGSSIRTMMERSRS